MRPRCGITQRTCGWKPRLASHAKRDVKNNQIENSRGHSTKDFTLSLGLESRRLAAAQRGLVNAGHQILSPQMRVPLEHLHRLVAANSRNFLIGKPCFDKTAHRSEEHTSELQSLRH